MLTHVLDFAAGVLLTSLYFRARIRALTRRLNTSSNALSDSISHDKETRP